MLSLTRILRKKEGNKKVKNTIRQKGKYSISELRRCPGCNTKSHSKFQGAFMIYTYHCKKCGEVFSRLKLSSLDLMSLYQKDPQKFGSVTVADIAYILENSPKEPMPVSEFFRRFEEISRKKKQQGKSKPHR